jgi:hypothetical protein
MSRFRALVALVLFLSLAISAVAAWRSFQRGPAAPTSSVGSDLPPARNEPTAPRKDADVKLPDDPKTVVLALWSEFVHNPRGERQWTHCEIRADGSGFWTDAQPPARSFSLAPAELQGLLRFIVREKRFFDIAKDQVHLDPKTAGTRGPYHINVLRVQADGRQHEVKYLLEAPPATPEVENLKAILARIETVKAAAIAKSNPAGKAPDR